MLQYWVQVHWFGNKNPHNRKEPPEHPLIKNSFLHKQETLHLSLN